jgi:Xaa-Pro aminopeptidase
MTDLAQRRDRLVAALPADTDAMLVSRVVNVRYLTGFTGSNAGLLVRRDGGAVFATDGRYLTQAASEVPDLDCVDARAVAPALAAYAAEAGIRRLGVEGDEVTLNGLALLREAAADRLDLVTLGPVVEALRAVKDQSELHALERACAITDAAFAAVVTQLRPGLTETDVAWSLRSAMHDNGAEGLAFDSIVAFGPHSAIPHHEPTGRELRTGDLVKLDFGARADGYHADMTRTVAVAPVADWQRELHAQVFDVQHACFEASTVGVLPHDLDAMARAGIERTGHLVAHGLGHGVGLEVHELPFLTATATADPLVPGVVHTVEPGIYLPDRGGVRIEDTVVTETAGPRSLTTSSRELLEVD